MVKNPRAPKVNPIISISDLQFRYHPDSELILNIDSLVVQPGQSLFIQGPSGSGKTTLLNLLAGVLVPVQGEISLLSTQLSTLSASERDAFRSNHIGFIFQLFNLIPYLSVIENVTLPCQFSQRRAGRTQSRTESQSKSKALPQREAIRILTHLEMEPFIHRSVTELSVGQQQRVAAARALIGSPELIIADEPTSSLDAHQRDRFIELLFGEIRQTGSTLIFVSHDAALAKHFDQVVNINELNRDSALKSQ